jgi:hypothetical protein
VLDVTVPKDDVQSADGADLLPRLQTDPAAEAKKELPFFPRLVPAIARAPMLVLFVSLIATATILIVLMFSGVLVPTRDENGLRGQIDNLKGQNDRLRGELKLSERKNKEYQDKLAGVSSEQARLQATINALEQQIETMRAAEWPPLTATAQEALYRQLKDMPAREVWVGYADSNGRALAKQFSDVFNQLNWPQKYDVLAVHDPQDGLWITPISDFSDQVRERIAQSTGLQFKLFPHSEQLPDVKQIGIIIGYRAPKNEGDP